MANKKKVRVPKIYVKQIKQDKSFILSDSFHEYVQIGRVVNAFRDLFSLKDIYDSPTEQVTFYFDFDYSGQDLALAYKLKEIEEKDTILYEDLKDFYSQTSYTFKKEFSSKLVRKRRITTRKTGTRKQVISSVERYPNSVDVRPPRQMSLTSEQTIKAAQWLQAQEIESRATILKKALTFVKDKDNKELVQSWSDEDTKSDKVFVQIRMEKLTMSPIQRNNALRYIYKHYINN